MNKSVQHLLESNDIQYLDEGTLQSSFHYSITSLDVLDDTEDNHFWSVTKRKLVKHLLKTYVSGAQFSLIDVGCGNGGLIQYLEHEFPLSNIAGMDGYVDALLHCRRRSKQTKLFLQDITRLSHSHFKTVFDVITLMDVLEHLDHPDFVLKDLHSFMAPGGIIIATVPASQVLWSDRDVFLGHRKRYDQSDFTTLFEQSGYKVLHANYAYSYLFPMAYVYRKWIAPFCRITGESVEASELRIIPIINGVLQLLGLMEISITNSLPVPFGTSVYIVAQKQ